MIPLLSAAGSPVPAQKAETPSKHSVFRAINHTVIGTITLLAAFGSPLSFRSEKAL